MMLRMRTTITLDEDVADQVRAQMSRLGQPFKHVIHEALRIGLAQMQTGRRSKPFRTRARPMHLRPGMCLDNVQELLSQVEGEDAR
jgi:hypothetical protein